MWVKWLLIYILAAVGVIGFIFMLGWLLDTKLASFFDLIDMYVLLALPIFFIIGCFLFADEKWSLTSTLAFICLIIFVYNGYFWFGSIFTHPNPLTGNDSTGVRPYLIRIFLGELIIVSVLVAKLILTHLQDRKLDKARENWSSD